MQKHAEARLKWAREHSLWRVDDWRKIVFSDEVSVEKSKDPNLVLVFRHRNRYEKYLPQNIIPRTKNPGVSLMLWGCFVSTIKGPLVTIHARATAFSYINLLQVNLIPFMNALSDQGITSAVFQQDNASIHKAYYTQEWFEQQTLGYGMAS